MHHHIHQVNNNHFRLLPERAIYWEEQNTLIVADIHLGKASHFRKSGLPVPVNYGKKDLDILGQLIKTEKPKKLLILGDLFHSDANQEWNWFKKWLSEKRNIEIYLVEGNHDKNIINEASATNLIVSSSLIMDSFIFTHEPLEEIPKKMYNFCGHIHPGVRIVGKGRQSLRFPCFWFGKFQAILPSFGTLTGHVSLSKEDASVYAIVEKGILKV